MCNVPTRRPRREREKRERQRYSSATKTISHIFCDVNDEEERRTAWCLLWCSLQSNARKRRLCKMRRFFEIYSGSKSPPNERNQNGRKCKKVPNVNPSFSLLICLFSVAFIKRGAVISTQWTGLPSCCCSCSCSCCYAWWWWWWFWFVFQTPGSSSWRTRRGS